jgi:hypothetical protein
MESGPGGEISDGALREMLEARERELEERRVRTSRSFTKILLAGGGIVAAAVWLFPDRKPVRVAAIPPPAAAPAGADPDLKPFMNTTSDDAHRGDLHFAMELLDYIRPRSGGK